MRKAILFISSLWILASCEQEPKNYVTFSGKITNKNSDSIVLSNRKLKFKKVIKVDENGVFKDTFKLKKNFLSLFDGKEYASLFLGDGDEVFMTLDAKMFDETISFKGKGAKESNFLAKKALMVENFEKDDSLYHNSKKSFEKKVRTFNMNVLRELSETESKDSIFTKRQSKAIKSFEKYVNKTYEDKKYILENLKPGTPSPEFTKPYENFKGGKTSLKDFRGKYVYIDIWATWCGYCKYETPFFKKIAEKYNEKNIAFVSISVDKNEKHDKWKKEITEKEIPGVHLFCNQDREFLKKYRVSGIPRFILLDPDGNIINAEAPRPSDLKLTKVLNNLKI